MSKNTSIILAIIVLVGVAAIINSHRGENTKGPTAYDFKGVVVRADENLFIMKGLVLEEGSFGEGAKEKDVSVYFNDKTSFKKGYTSGEAADSPFPIKSTLVYEEVDAQSFSDAVSNGSVVVSVHSDENIGDRSYFTASEMSYLSIESQ